MHVVGKQYYWKQLTVQVDLLQQTVPIHFTDSFFNSTYVAFEMEQSIMNGD